MGEVVAGLPKGWRIFRSILGFHSGFSTEATDPLLVFHCTSSTVVPYLLEVLALASL